MNRWTTSLVLLITCFLGLIGCGSIYDTFNIGGSSSTTGASESSNPSSPVTYAVVNAQIFSPICINCHSMAGGNRGGVNLETYANVIKNLTRVQQAVDTDFMPLGGPPLSTELKNLLNNWIANGAPQEEAPMDSQTTKLPEVYFPTE